MCATLVGNCDIHPCCARRRLSSHPSASAQSTADKLANNLYVQIKLIWKLVAGFSINRYSNMAQEKINPSMFGHRRTVVYTVLVASGGSWNSVSGEQIRLQLSSSASRCLGVSFYCSGAAVSQQGATSALQFCGAAPRWRTVYTSGREHRGDEILEDNCPTCRSALPPSLHLPLH